MEKFFKIYRMIICWIPLVLTIITDELSINNKIKNFILLILFIPNIIIVIISFKIEKNEEIWNKIFALIVLTLSIGYMIYLAIKKFM